jgi:hypothetical protein
MCHVKVLAKKMKWLEATPQPAGEDATELE